MTLTTAEEIYEQVVKPLPVTERQRLVEKIVHDLSMQPVEGAPSKRYDWMSIRGISPNLLGGKNAQQWVSHTRCESDVHREKPVAQEK